MGKMKKTVILLAMVMMLNIWLTACSKEEAAGDASTGTENVAACVTVDFDSYEEYLAFFSGASTLSAGDNSLEAEYGEEIADYVGSVASGQSSLIVPYFDNAPIPLRTEEGYSSVTYFSRELYDLPWTWFHTYIGDSLIAIHISELNEDAISMASDKTCSEFLSVLAPSAPNIHNYDEFANYSTVYEDTFSVGGAMVCGLVQETTDGKTYTNFIVDECLVSISAPADTVTDEWLGRLSFVRVSG